MDLMQVLYSSPNSWISILVATWLAPFFYSTLLRQVNHFLQKVQQRLTGHLDRCEYVYVYDSRTYSRNSLYWHVSTYLNFKVETEASSKSAAINPPLEQVLLFALQPGERISDTYQGTVFTWESCSSDRDDDNKVFFKLSVPKEKKSLERPYLLHIAETVQKMEATQNQRYLYSYRARNEYWDRTVFKHPASFNSLALELQLKTQIMNDLKEFAESKEYYKSVGKPWKRGYLLHGPPGTGKSTLIAAIANYLNYDIYDLDLVGVSNNAELRQLLMQTTNKSVIVIEDIDCCFSTSLKTRSGSDFSTSSSGITLSGMLNFCDGLWSSCGDERIFIFTTNHVENLDPALLRKGRMDLHIAMSYCGFEAFKQLMNKYLRIDEHELLEKIEGLITQTQVTPADVAEVLLESRNDATFALENFVSFLEGTLLHHGNVEVRKKSRKATTKAVWKPKVRV